MNLKKRIAALMLAAMLVIGIMSSAMADNAVNNDLAAQIASSIGQSYATELGDNFKVYSNLDTVKWTEAQPARFDLRDRGLVPTVRSQGSLGTCWSFAHIAAARSVC